MLQLRFKFLLLGGIGRIFHLLPDLVEQVRAFLYLQRFDGSAFPALRKGKWFPLWSPAIGISLEDNHQLQERNHVACPQSGTWLTRRHFRTLRSLLNAFFHFLLPAELGRLAISRVLN